jgi:multidrug resistance efflux pump
MSTDDTLGMTYEMRRRARRPDAPKEETRWRAWMLAVGIGSFAAGVLALGLWLYWSMTYVYTIRAKVSGGTIFLSTDFDGRLCRLGAQEGQAVSEGETLAWFDDAEPRGELASAEAVVALQKGACDGAQKELESAALTLELARLQAVEENHRAVANLKNAEAVLRRLQSGSREEEIGSAEARLASAQALQSLYELRVTQSAGLHERGIEPQIELEIKRTQLATQRNTVRENELQLAQLTAGPRPEDIEVAQQAVNARQADLALAKMSELTLKGRELDVARLQARLAQAKAELGKAEADLQVRRAALDKLAIKSPADGIVSRVYFHPGEVVRKGEFLIELIEASGGRWVEGYVLEEDAERIQPGQPVKIRIGTDSGQICQGELADVGFSSAPGTGGRDRAFSELGSFGRPAPVWVRIRLPDQDTPPRLGTSAKARIKVR